MKALILKDINNIALDEISIPEEKEGNVILKVLYCSLCRTDAKLWNSGQRDLILPRILGHEVSGIDLKTGYKYIIWPGISCKQCFYCKNDFENLCDDIKIIGFNRNGGLAEFISVPEYNLIPISENIPEHLASMAEPLACAINAIEMLKISPQSKVLIYGAGTLGLMLALVVKEYGAFPFVVDIHEDKLIKATPFLEKLIVPATLNSDDGYDFVINATSAQDSVIEGISKLKKLGTYCLFSGLTRSEISFDKILNDVHYRQLHIVGAYGCTKNQMIQALKFIEKFQDLISLLVEEIITLEQVANSLNNVLSGKFFKYIVEINAK